MKKIIQRLRIAAALAVLLALSVGNAWADFTMTNPVTGENESYTWKFVGTSVWNGTDFWQDSSGANPSNVPGKTDEGADWSPMLFDGSSVKLSNVGMSVEGWNLRMGLYNGAYVNLKNLVKIQGETAMWITVDEASQLKISTFNGGNLGNQDGGQPIKLYVAKSAGITWSAACTTTGHEGNTFEYYLKGDGSVSYQALNAANHEIKQADVTLSEAADTKVLRSKTLVSFTSTTKTFTADASIYVKNADSSALKTVTVSTVNSTGTPTLDASTASVGDCELVQTSTGVFLYYVDYARTYSPSININFCHGNTPLTIAGDVGVDEYAAPGTSWNNMISAGGNDGTFTTPLSTIYGIDSAGVQSLISGTSVAVSGTRGSWSCGNNGITAATDLRQGYIDDNDGNASPQIVVSGIPYYSYKTVLYFSNDTEGVNLGYVTVNGKNYTWSDGALAEGTSNWGSTSSASYIEGGNYLVIPAQVNSDGTLTVVTHRLSECRAGLAAVQIVEVEADVGENDLLIDLTGDQTYTFDEAKTYDTVYVTGSGTVTFAGEASSATTLEIALNAAVNMVSSALTSTTVTGSGTAVYNGAQPSSTVGFNDSSAWKGTVWVKNLGDYDSSNKSNTNLGSVTSGQASANPVNSWGNANSYVKFTNVKGYMYAASIPWTLILENDGDKNAWYNNNGWGSETITIARLKGDGTFYDAEPTSGNVCNQPINFTDVSAFTGTMYVRGKRIGMGGGTTVANTSGTFGQYGSICVPVNATATLSSGMTWTTYGGFVVNGTLNGNGTLECSNSESTSSIIGSGVVVFNGSMPSVNGSAWWQNAYWTGTLWVKNATISALDSNLYGNSESTLKFSGVTGYFAENHVNTVPIELEDSGSIAAFEYNDGWGGELQTFSELKGTGTFKTSAKGNGGTIWVKKFSNFSGAMTLAYKKVILGGSEPTHPNTNWGGQLVIAEDSQTATIASGKSWGISSSVTVDGTLAVNGFIWASEGITVNGVLSAAQYATSGDGATFGGGTAITVGDTGTFRIANTSGNPDETSLDYGKVDGTGTLEFAGTGYRCISSSNFPTNLVLKNEQTDGLLLKTAGATYTVGSLSGSKQFRADWTASSAARKLKVLQAKDTTWSGLLKDDNRLGTVEVAPGVSTSGTLTLSGTQVLAAALNVDSGAAVNLTGTWKGTTTVDGTFGGTGSVGGDLTLNSGSTFKAFATDSDGLTVSGAVTLPEEGTVTVDVSGVTATSGKVVLMTVANATLDAGKFALASGSRGELLVEDNALKLNLTTYVAQYGGTSYTTIQDAIDAAVQDGHTYADVTILDANAECPAGYYVDTENNNTLAMYQAAIVQNNNGVISTSYFKTAQLAVGAIEANSALYTYYSHFEVYFGTSVAMAISPSATAWVVLPIKIKCLNGATVDVSYDSAESELTAGEADANDIVTYKKTNKATIYVWKASSTSQWARPTNWAVGTSDGAQATRAPDATDTVILGDGANVTDVSSAQNVAALQVSGTVTISGGGTLTSASAITLATGDSITITGTLSPVPTTSVADSYVKTATVDSTTTYSVDAYNTVTFEVTNASYSRTDALGTSIKDGDTITFTVEPDSGYAVSGVTVGGGMLAADNGTYSYTVTGNATITVTTVSTTLTIGAATAEYLADFSKAKTVSATVTAGTVLDGTIWTLKTNGVAVAGVTGSYADGTVTFSDVSVTLGDSITYSIEATGGSTGTSAESAASTVGTETSGWIVEDSAHTASTGAWLPSIAYTDTTASISEGATYTPKTASGGDVVTLTTVVKFGAEADPEIDIGEAQAALKIASVDNALAFQVWTRADENATAAWATTAWAGGTVSADTEYTVVFKIDYGARTYSVKVGDQPLTISESSTFLLARADATSVTSIAYNGTGTFKSLTGSYVGAEIAEDFTGGGSATVSSAFVKSYLADKTVAAATAALNPDATNATDYPAAFAPNGNGISYFNCYALGLDPTKEDDKPIVDVTVDDGGNYVFTVKHPVYDNEGAITGYVDIEAADNVSTAVTLKYGTGADAETWTSAEGTTIAPSALPFDENGNVLYYKAEVSIDAK